MVTLVESMSGDKICDERRVKINFCFREYETPNDKLRYVNLDLNGATYY